MNTQEFRKELNARIARHDLLTHPFYQAWAKGELTREDLCCYAMQYFIMSRRFRITSKCLSHVRNSTAN